MDGQAWELKSPTVLCPICSTWSPGSSNEVFELDDEHGGHNGIECSTIMVQAGEVQYKDKILNVKIDALFFANIYSFCIRCQQHVSKSWDKTLVCNIPQITRLIGCVSARGMGNTSVKALLMLKSKYRIWSNICHHPDDIIFRGIPAYFSKSMPSHNLHVLQPHGFVVKECRY